MELIAAIIIGVFLTIITLGEMGKTPKQLMEKNRIALKEQADVKSASATSEIEAAMRSWAWYLDEVRYGRMPEALAFTKFRQEFPEYAEALLKVHGGD
jgi:hypothetical protein